MIPVKSSSGTARPSLCCRSHEPAKDTNGMLLHYPGVVRPYNYLAINQGGFGEMESSQKSWPESKSQACKEFLHQFAEIRKGNNTITVTSREDGFPRYINSETQIIIYIFKCVILNQLCRKGSGTQVL